MVSTLYVFLAISALSVLTLADNVDVTAPKKKVTELWFSPLMALIIVKFKLLLAFLVLTGTASITKFIAGLVHILATQCKSKHPRPVYIKYESPSHEQYHTFEKPYYTNKDFYYHRKKAVGRAVPSIGGIEK